MNAPPERQSAPLRICIVYDRLYPWSIGGAERWYRLLAEHLAREGHRVTYVTSHHWPAGEHPAIDDVQIVTLGRADEIYDRRRRRMGPPARFGFDVWCHLARHGGRYDVVHGSAMSAWSALAAGSLCRLHGFRLVLDWWEVWSRPNWQEYLGAAPGLAAWCLQRSIARAPHQPLAYSELHANRLRALGPRQPVPTIRGLLPIHRSRSTGPVDADPLVVFVGRHIPEKQAPAIVPAIELARRQFPSLRATLFGDGPDHFAVRRAVAAANLGGAIALPGFVSESALSETLRRALCLILLSRREGYGLVVVEAAAFGVPSIVLRHPDSAASELIVDGVNGYTVTGTDPCEIASVILRIHDAGRNLRQSTFHWFECHRDELTIEGSLPHVLAAYRGTSDEVRTRTWRQGRH